MHGTGRVTTPRRGIVVLRALTQASAAAAALVLTLLVAAGSSGLALVHQCIPLTGAAAWTGTQLAVVRATPDCPEGVALGGTTTAAVHVVVALALPVLVAHLAAAVLVWGGAGQLAQGLGRLRVLVGARLDACLSILAVRPVRAPRSTVLVVVPPGVRPLARLAGVVVRRGPPALAV